MAPPSRPLEYPFRFPRGHAQLLSSSPASAGGYSVRPRWLEDMLHDHSAPPKLFSWTPANLPGGPSGRLPQVNAPSRESDSSRRIYVLGVGNLGRLFATSLAKTPGLPPVTLVFHKRTLLEQWVSNPGLEMVRSGVGDRVVNFDVEWWTEQRPDSGPVAEVCHGQPIPNLIVATKAPDALPQADRLRGYLDSNSTVAFVQNGMNRLWPPYGAEFNAHRFRLGGHPNWVVCVTTHGVISLGSFSSIHASPADVAMGPVSLDSDYKGQAEFLMDSIAAAPHLDARKVTRSSLWVLQLEKLVVNCIINPLTAVLRCKNGVLFTGPDRHVTHTIDLLVEEASRVLQALVQDKSSHAILLEYDASSGTEEAANMRPDSLLDRFSASRLREMLYTVGAKVKDNTSSMLQDAMAGKKTEIREINGWLVDTADYLGGLDMKNHKMLIQLVEDGASLEGSQLGKYFPP